MFYYAAIVKLKFEALACFNIAKNYFVSIAILHVKFGGLIEKKTVIIILTMETIVYVKSYHYFTIQPCIYINL